jgi:hypothetical protein
LQGCGRDERNAVVTKIDVPKCPNVV